MTILLTGGNGKTGLKIASLLYNAGIPILVASRSGEAPAPYQAVKFDWLDESTYDACFEGTGVDKIYLVPPPVATDIFEPMRKFIDLAITKGVKRFVFLSGSPWDENSSMSGVVHKYLTNLGVDYCILRPTWFMRESWIFFLLSSHPDAASLSENLSEQEYHHSTIVTDSKIYSCRGKGVVPWISTDDVAAVAVRALVDEKSHNTDHLILGPELLSYDQVRYTFMYEALYWLLTMINRHQVVQKLSLALGRTITHVNISEEEYVKHLSTAIPENYAIWLAGMDTAIANGSEERTNNVVETVTGRPAKDFDTFIEENKKAWAV